MGKIHSEKNRFYYLLKKCLVIIIKECIVDKNKSKKTFLYKKNIVINNI